MGIIDFIREAINRLKSKSPKFFSVLQIFGAAVIILGYSPWAITRYTTWEMSPQFVNLCSDIAGKATGFLLAALFAVSSPVVAQTQEGEAIKKTDENKMPFTAKAEAKVVEDAKPPLPVDKDLNK